MCSDAGHPTPLARIDRVNYEAVSCKTHIRTWLRHATYSAMVLMAGVALRRTLWWGQCSWGDCFDPTTTASKGVTSETRSPLRYYMKSRYKVQPNSAA